MAESRARFHSREEARAILTAKLERERAFQAAMVEERERFPNWPQAWKHSASCDPQLIIDDCEWRLRWLDCAPASANHQIAMMQDKTGTPCGGAWNENVGPSQELRDAGDRRGGWQMLKRRQAEQLAAIEAARS